MSNISKTYRMMTSAYTTELSATPEVREGILRYATNLIEVFFSLLNGLIGLRFLLRLILPNQANPFMEAVYSITSPFVWALEGLIPSPSFRGGEIELYCLLAILVYALLGWLMIQGLWLPFARTK